MHPRLLLLVLTVWICALDQLSAQTPPSGSPLKDLGAPHHLLIGAATDLNHSDPNEEAIVKREYSILSSENCLKPNKTEPARNTFDFSRSDSFVSFCRQNGIIAKGHTLLGQNLYIPKWMLNPSLSVQDLHDILVNHITQVMGRYKKGSSYGEIKYWDVVNEVCGRTCVFEKLGKNSDGDFNYWTLAFETAHQVDPSCTLIWNEDNMETDPKKAESVYQIISRLKAKGVPIDAVGFQCHVGWGNHPVPNDKYLTNIFQKFADNGISIVISEMDVPQKLDPVSVYPAILKVCLNQPKCIIWDTWNVLDKYSWRKKKEQGGWLLFDDDYAPKPAYYAVQAALQAP